MKIAQLLFLTRSPLALVSEKSALCPPHAASLHAGANDEGAPGVRATYPMPGGFTAYLRDPWGNKIELVHGGFST